MLSSPGDHWLDRCQFYTLMLKFLEFSLALDSGNGENRFQTVKYLEIKSLGKLRL